MDWKVIRLLLTTLYTLYYNVGSTYYDAYVPVVRNYFKSMAWLAPVFETEVKTVEKEVPGETQVKYIWQVSTGYWKGIVRKEFETVLDKFHFDLTYRLDSGGKIRKIDAIKMLREYDQSYNEDDGRYYSNIGLKEAKWLIETYFPMYLK